MTLPCVEPMTLALEDLFDCPGEPASAGVAFLRRQRQGLPEGSALYAQLGAAQWHSLPSIQFAAGDKGSPPWALAVEQGRYEAALGVDESAWMRLAAIRHDLYGLRFFHEAWLGRGCVALAPAVSGIGCLAREPEALRTLAQALLKKDFPRMDVLSGILDLGPYLPLQGDLPPEYVGMLAAMRTSDDVETAHWLLKRFEGVELAHMVLAAREASERFRPWMASARTELPQPSLDWLEAVKGWGEATVQAAHRKESELAAAFRDVFQRFNAVAMPFGDAVRMTEGVTTRARLGLPVDLARLPAVVLPLGKGIGLQLIFPDLGRTALP